jgi:hypothetical protein
VCSIKKVKAEIMEINQQSLHLTQLKQFWFEGTAAIV